MSPEAHALRRLRRGATRLGLEGSRLAYGWREALLGLRLRCGRGIRHLYGPARVELGPEEVVLLCMVKDGAPWLPSFLRHHEDLGVRHTVLLDNGSEDATLEILTSRDRVSVFRTDLPFATYNVPLKRWLVKRFGGRGWRLYCDVDELFEYPFHERLALRSFLRYLNRHDYTAVAAQMLDMFPAEPLGEIQGREERDLKCDYPFFDIAHVEKTVDKYWLRMNDLGTEDLRFHRGGVRARVFGAAGAMLTKHPLLRPGGGLRIFPYDDHFVTGARLADVTGVLRHYTFTAALLDKIESYTAENAHFNTRHVYERYARVWTESGDLRLRAPTAERYEGARALLDRGFLVGSERYRAWASWDARMEASRVSEPA